LLARGQALRRRFVEHCSWEDAMPTLKRTVYLTFDVDANGSGQQASQQLAYRLRARGIATRRVLLPPGHDPNHFFVQSGDARQFQSLLEAAQP